VCVEVVCKRGRRRRREDKSVQAAMSCAGCELLLTARLQAVSTDLQTDTDQQLDNLRQRVHKAHFSPFYDSEQYQYISIYKFCQEIMQ